MIGADTQTLDVETAINGCLEEGFGVDWGERHGQLYLCVWEPQDVEIDWNKVFAERHLDEEEMGRTDEMLRHLDEAARRGEAL